MAHKDLPQSVVLWSCTKLLCGKFVHNGIYSYQNKLLKDSEMEFGTCGFIWTWDACQIYFEIKLLVQKLA